MAEVYVSSFTAGTAIPIAAENIGGTNYVQQVKLLGGQAGSTQAIPGDSASGMYVNLQGIGVTVGVSGVVSVSGPVMTTTQAAVTGMEVWLGPSQTVLVTIVGGAGGGGSVTTAPPAISATGQVVYIAGGQGTTVNPVVVTGTVTAGAGTTVISGTISVSNTVVATLATGGTIASVLGTVNVTQVGTALVSVVPGVSVSLGGLANAVVTTTASSGQSGPIVWLGVNQTLATVATVGTILGTQVVSVVPGLSVSAVVSGTITANLPGSTTGSSGMSGVLVWLGASQSVLIGGQSITIQQGASVSAVVSGTVTVAGSVALSGTGLVSVVPGLSVSAVVSGTVSLVNIVPVTTQTSVSVSGLPVYFGPGALISVSGTAIVSVVPGLSVSAVVSGTVSVGNTVVVSLANVVVSTTGSSGQSGQVVWLGQNQTIATVGTVSTVLGTLLVSQVGGASVSAVVSGTVSILNVVPVTTAASVSVTGLPVWLNPTQTVAVSGAVLAVTTQSNATGAAIWLAPTQTIIAGPSLCSPVLMLVSQTVVGPSTTMLFTVYTGATFVTAGTSAWAVPSGKTFRLLDVQLVAQASAAFVPGYLVVIVGTAAASITVTATVGVLAATPYVLSSSGITTPAVYQENAQFADVAAGTTIGVGMMLGTSCTVNMVVVEGILF